MTSVAQQQVSERGTQSVKRGLFEVFRFRNASLIYVLILLIVIFGLWIPDLFLTQQTWRSLLEGQAITTIVAVGLCLPLAAGVFDLSVGLSVGWGAMFVSWLAIKEGLPVGLSIVVTLASGVAIGLINGFLVSVVRIDSFIATLGVQSVLIASITILSGGQQILGLPSGLTFFAQHEIGGLTLPVFIMLALAIVAWYLLENTPLGRRIYGTGGNAEAARLAGVRTPVIVAMTFALCSLAAVIAGVLVAATEGAGDPTVGPTYLLPPFTAAFLGSTQFRNGRFNVLGTVVAVYVLAVGVKGLQLAGGPVWLPDMFNGLALVVAVGLTRTNRGRSTPLGRLIWRRRPASGDPDPQIVQQDEVTVIPKEASRAR